MTDSFNFNAYDIGQPTQHIIFRQANAPEQRFEVPDMVIPQDPVERFWALYNKLVELGAIPNRTPVFNA